MKFKKLLSLNQRIEMKISKFSKYIKENSSFDYSSYFQAIMDEWDDKISVSFSEDGEIEIQNMKLNSSDRENFGDIKIELSNINKFINDLNHILDNMAIDGIKYRIYIDTEYNVNIVITNIELENNKIDFRYLFNLLKKDNINIDMSGDSVIFKCKFIRNSEYEENSISFANIQNYCRVGEGHNYVCELYILFHGRLGILGVNVDKIYTSLQKNLGSYFDIRIGSKEEGEYLAKKYVDNSFRRPTIIISKKP